MMLPFLSRLFIPFFLVYHVLFSFVSFFSRFFPVISFFPCKNISIAKIISIVPRRLFLERGTRIFQIMYAFNLQLYIDIMFVYHFYMHTFICNNMILMHIVCTLTFNLFCNSHQVPIYPIYCCLGRSKIFEWKWC